MNSNTVRIIAGRWRGRKIAFPDVDGLRPTGDRVRETVFNWLQTELPDTHCLDLFCGSGAFGFEALSRGAASAVLVDHHPDIVQTVQQTAESLSADVSIIQAKIPSPDLTIQLNNKQFDIVFIDPPFNKNLLAPTIQWLQDSHCLADGALVYVEAERELSSLPIPNDWEILRDKTAGHVRYFLMRTCPMQT